ncbi:MAG: hypothetical protein ACI841_003921 [Planctomycetota bacterium]|jgi:hypothetical protein
MTPLLEVHDELKLSEPEIEFTIYGSQVMGNGLLLYGANAASIPFEAGTLCVGGSIARAKLGTPVSSWLWSAALDITSAQVNSGSNITLRGLPSVALDTLTLYIRDLPAYQPGLLFMSSGIAHLPFGDGLRCVTGAIQRFPVGMTDSAGVWIEGGRIVQMSQGFGRNGAIQAGDRRYFQCWYRNPLGPCSSGFNLSQALEVVFTP